MHAIKTKTDDLYLNNYAITLYLQNSKNVGTLHFLVYI